MLSLRGVVDDLRAYSNLLCVVSAFLALFLALVFFSLSDFDQDLTPVFVPPVPFFCVRIIPRSQFGVIGLLSFMGSFEYSRANGVHCKDWILRIWFYELSNAYCDMDIIP